MKLSAASIKTTLSISALSSLLLCNLAIAESHTNHKEHAAHEHGAARLTVATTDSGLEVTLESPAANVFGFEHLASTKEDHHTIHEAEEVLEAGEALLITDSAAACTLASVKIESAQVDAHNKEKHGDHDDHGHEKHEDHDEDKHEDHGHEKHDDHDKEKHDDHGHEKHEDHDEDKHDEHDHESESTHNDVDVTWNFNCKNPAKLTQVDVRLFSAFPKGFEDIDVDWITATKSGHQELDSDGVVKLPR